MPVAFVRLCGNRFLHRSNGVEPYYPSGPCGRAFMCTCVRSSITKCATYLRPILKVKVKVMLIFTANISKMVTDQTNVIIAITYEVAYRISLRFDLGPL